MEVDTSLNTKYCLSFLRIYPLRSQQTTPWPFPLVWRYYLANINEPGRWWHEPGHWVTYAGVTEVWAAPGSHNIWCRLVTLCAAHVLPRIPKEPQSAKLNHHNCVWLLNSPGLRVWVRVSQSVTSVTTEEWSVTCRQYCLSVCLKSHDTFSKVKYWNHCFPSILEENFQFCCYLYSPSFLCLTKIKENSKSFLSFWDHFLFRWL